MNYKFMARVKIQDNYKNLIINSEFDQVDKKRLKQLLSEKYHTNIDIYEILKVTDTQLISGVYHEI